MPLKKIRYLIPGWRGDAMMRNWLAWEEEMKKLW